MVNKEHGMPKGAAVDRHRRVAFKTNELPFTDTGPKHNRPIPTKIKDISTEDSEPKDINPKITTEPKNGEAKGSEPEDTRPEAKGTEEEVADDELMMLRKRHFSDLAWFRKQCDLFIKPPKNIKDASRKQVIDSLRRKAMCRSVREKRFYSEDVRTVPLGEVRWDVPRTAACACPFTPCICSRVTRLQPAKKIPRGGGVEGSRCALWRWFLRRNKRIKGRANPKGILLPKLQHRLQVEQKVYLKVQKWNKQQKLQLIPEVEACLEECVPFYKDKPLGKKIKIDYKGLLKQFREEAEKEVKKDEEHLLTHKEDVRQIIVVKNENDEEEFIEVFVPKKDYDAQPNVEKRIRYSYFYNKCSVGTQTRSLDRLRPAAETGAHVKFGRLHPTHPCDDEGALLEMEPVDLCATCPNTLQMADYVGKRYNEFKRDFMRRIFDVKDRHISRPTQCRDQDIDNEYAYMEKILQEQNKILNARDVAAAQDAPNDKNKQASININDEISNTQNVVIDQLEPGGNNTNDLSHVQGTTAVQSKHENENPNEMLNVPDTPVGQIEPNNAQPNEISNVQDAITVQTKTENEKLIEMVNKQNAIAGQFKNQIKSNNEKPKNPKSKIKSLFSKSNKPQNNKKKVKIKENMSVTDKTSPILNKKESSIKKLRKSPKVQKKAQTIANNKKKVKLKKNISIADKTTPIPNKEEPWIKKCCKFLKVTKNAQTIVKNEKKGKIKTATPITEMPLKTATSELPAVTTTPVSEIGISSAPAPTAEILSTELPPTTEISMTTPTSELQPVTPTIEIPRTKPPLTITPTEEIPTTTLTSMPSALAPTIEMPPKESQPSVISSPDILTTTPTSELQAVTPTIEIPTTKPPLPITSTAEISKTTTTSEPQLITPTTEKPTTEPPLIITPTEEIPTTTPISEPPVVAPLVELPLTETHLTTNETTEIPPTPTTEPLSTIAPTIDIPAITPTSETFTVEQPSTKSSTAEPPPTVIPKILPEATGVIKTDPDKPKKTCNTCPKCLKNKQSNKTQPLHTEASRYKCSKEIGLQVDPKIKSNITKRDKKTSKKYKKQDGVSHTLCQYEVPRMIEPKPRHNLIGELFQFCKKKKNCVKKAVDEWTNDSQLNATFTGLPVTDKKKKNSKWKLRFKWKSKRRRWPSMANNVEPHDIRQIQHRSLESNRNDTTSTGTCTWASILDDKVPKLRRGKCDAASKLANQLRLDDETVDTEPCNSVITPNNDLHAETSKPIEKSETDPCNSVIKPNNDISTENSKSVEKPDIVSFNSVITPNNTIEMQSQLHTSNHTESIRNEVNDKSITNADAVVVELSNIQLPVSGTEDMRPDYNVDPSLAPRHMHMIIPNNSINSIRLSRGICVIDISDYPKILDNEELLNPQKEIPPILPQQTTSTTTLPLVTSPSATPRPMSPTTIRPSVPSLLQLSDSRAKIETTVTDRKTKKTESRCDKESEIYSIPHIKTDFTISIASFRPQSIPHAQKLSSSSSSSSSSPTPPPLPKAKKPTKEKIIKKPPAKTESICKKYFNCFDKPEKSSAVPLFTSDFKISIARFKPKITPGPEKESSSSSSSSTPPPPPPPKVKKSPKPKKVKKPTEKSESICKRYFNCFEKYKLDASRMKPQFDSDYRISKTSLKTKTSRPSVLESSSSSSSSSTPPPLPRPPPKTKKLKKNKIKKPPVKKESCREKFMKMFQKPETREAVLFKSDCRISNKSLKSPPSPLQKKATTSKSTSKEPKLQPLNDSRVLYESQLILQCDLEAKPFNRSLQDSTGIDNNTKPNDKIPIVNKTSNVKSKTAKTLMTKTKSNSYNKTNISKRQDSPRESNFEECTTSTSTSDSNKNKRTELTSQRHVRESRVERSSTSLEIIIQSVNYETVRTRRPRDRTNDPTERPPLHHHQHCFDSRDKDIRMVMEHRPMKRSKRDEDQHWIARTTTLESKRGLSVSATAGRHILVAVHRARGADAVESRR